MKASNIKERALKAVDENIKTIEGALHQIKYHRERLSVENDAQWQASILMNICHHLRAMASHIDIVEIARVSVLIDKED